jgi:hypothetical protein
MHAMDYYITKYQGKMMQSMTPLFAAMTQGIRKLRQARRAREASGTASRQRPCRRAGQEKTKNKRRSAEAGAAEMHSLSLHGEQMLLAFVRGNRRFRAHRRRLDQHAPYGENLHQAAAVDHPGVQKDFKR